MPPGKKAPPQQSSLTELWASKPKKQNAPAAPAGTSDGTVDAAGPTKSSEERAYCFSPL
jgi:hypothetical protein